MGDGIGTFSLLSKAIPPRRVLGLLYQWGVRLLRALPQPLPHESVAFEHTFWEAGPVELYKEWVVAVV